jgi:LysM repeat protein
MFKNLFMLLVLVFSLFGLQAQEKLIVQGKPGDWYVEHTVFEKETLSSMGRFFKVSVKDLAAYNRINAAATIAQGQVIRVPLTVQNFLPLPESPSSEPIYHLSTTADNVFRISKKYNDVPLANLRRWNDLKSDQIRSGQALVVGWLAGTGMVSSEKMSDGAATTEFIKVPVVTGNKALDAQPLKNPNVVDAQADGARELQAGTMKPLSEADLFYKKLNDDKAKKEADAVAAVVPPPVSLEEFNANNVAPLSEQALPEMNIPYQPNPGDEGYFGLHFASLQGPDKKTMTRQLNAAWFKTNQVSNDRKFYALCSKMLPGTILRINAGGTKFICARVLGPIPANTVSDNIELLLSNTGAQALGLGAGPATLRLAYFQ